MYKLVAVALVCLAILPGCMYMAAANLGASVLSSLTAPGPPAEPPVSPQERATIIEAYQRCMERRESDSTVTVSCSKELFEVLESGKH